MIRWPHLATAFLGTFTFQVGALQTQSTAGLDTGADTLSFSTLVDVLYSDDQIRLRAARKNIISLCRANGVQNNFSPDCDTNHVARFTHSRHEGFVFVLVGHIRDNVIFDTFTQAYESIRHFHPQNSIIVVDNASPPDVSAQVVDFVNDDPNAIYLREGSSGFEIGGYARALKSARKRQWKVRGWVFLQATAVLLQPLPLESLPCKVNSFFSIGVKCPPCGLPEFNAAEYEAFRQDHERSKNDTEWRILEFRRLKHEFPLWDRYEKLACTESPIGRNTPSAMHNMFIATAEGSSGLEDLGFFSMRLETKRHSVFMEAFNGIFLAALDSSNTSCTIDKERRLVGQSKASGPGTFIHKQHGEFGGWGVEQTFFHRFLGFIRAVDANRDTLVDAAEIADAMASSTQSHTALRNLCDAMANQDPFQRAMGCTV